MFEKAVANNKLTTDEQFVAAAWDENVNEWTAQVRAGQDSLREIFNNPLFFDAFLPDLRGLSVLDLGCGEGYNTRLLAKRGAKVTGVDLSGRMIDAACSAEAIEPLGIAYRVSSFASLEDFQDSSFDAAVSSMALMNSPNLKHTMGAVFRVLRPGGHFCFSVLHPCFWTRGSRWVKRSNGPVEGLLLTDYWLDEPYVERWQFDSTSSRPFSVPRFPHRLEDYINKLAEAGFRITRMLEPRPTTAMVSKVPALLTPIREHVPIFLYVSAAKPESGTP